MKRLKFILSLYLIGLIAYQILPVKVIPYINYAPRELYPVPMIYRYSFAYDVHTAFSTHAGSIKNLLKAMDERGFDIAFGDFPEAIQDRLFPTPAETECLILKSTDISIPARIGHLLFERIPKLLTGSRTNDILSLIDPEEFSNCYLVAHDEKILISTSLGFEFPAYSFILGNRRNVHFSRDVIIRSSSLEDLLSGSAVIFGDRRIRVFAFSERSFYLPGEKTPYPFRYVVETDLERPLIMIYKDSQIKGIYNQNRLNVKVSSKGKYWVKIMSYKFRIHIFYFGVRTVAVVSPITLL